MNYNNINKVDTCLKKTPIEYIFIDKDGEIRSKSKILDYTPTQIEDIPKLEIDTEMMKLLDSNKDFLIPVALYDDPFRPDQDGKLVLCQHSTRVHCKEIMDHYADLEPWFGIEQEYILFDIKTNKPLGWPTHGEPEPQGKYYCGVGAGRIFGRDIMEAHYRACLYAGITLCGCNAEATPSQLEYQVGPCVGVNVGDELWVARYIMERITEEFGYRVSLHPKPILGNWNPSGCHTNFSTKEMRQLDGGLEAMDRAIENMSEKHVEHIELYGQDNHMRLTGEYETGHISVFSYGVGNRGASIRIPIKVAIEGKGYMEDRRPASNINPYEVITVMMKSSFNYKPPYEIQFHPFF